MKYLDETTSNVSVLVENQFPDFVRENNETFLNFISSYYEHQENKYNSLDVASNLIDYYNIRSYNKDKLVKSTKLNQTTNVSKTATELTVESTKGFPDINGYIKIDNEIIYYKSKTNTKFLDCTRGTSALMLERVPRSNVTLSNSTAAEHLKTAVVENIAYNFTSEFLSRIKSELAPLIPEVLDESVSLASFIKNIKSFYSAKGSLNSHKILFKILFNDRKFNIKLKPRGSGAKLQVNNRFGKIEQTSVFVIDGGTDFDSRVDTNGDLISPPIVDIIGSGFGEVDTSTGLRKNKTAVINIVKIDSNGSIPKNDSSAFVVTDKGESYKGAVIARVRPRAFYEDQIVRNASGTGTGRVEYYDAFTQELILYDVSGYFLPNEEIFTDTEEKARAFISQSFVNPTTSRNGTEVIGEEQTIEFPKDYTFKTSGSSYSDKRIIKCRLLDGYNLPNDILPDALILKQDKDKVFNVPGVSIEVDNNIPLFDNQFELDITTNSDFENLFLPSSTVATLPLSGLTSSSNNFVLTVDEASRFPITNGIVFVNGKEILYKTRSVNQLFGCSYFRDLKTPSTPSTLNIGIKDKVISLARLKVTDVWTTSTQYNVGDYVYYGDNLYLAQNTGTSGSDSPDHTSGEAYDGTIVNANPIKWRYISKNRFDHTLHADINGTNVKFELLGIPGGVVIEEGGSLHNTIDYGFARFDSPNVNAYNFTTPEISDRLSLVLGTNYNWTRKSVLEESGDTSTTTDRIQSLKSYESLVGFNAQYDFEDHIYVAGSGIPRWWKDIVDLSSTEIREGYTGYNAAAAKKLAFTNQKLLTRWKKSGLISDTQAIGVGRKTKKLIGLNLDAIQVNSYKGNAVQYGYVNKFFIADGGEYSVVYSEDGNGFGYSVNQSKLPKLKVNNNTYGNAYNLVRISGSLKSINFVKLNSLWGSSNLTGFTNKPKIEVINNNPITESKFTSFSGINTTTNIVTVSSHQFQTGQKVTFESDAKYFVSLSNNDELYIRKISGDTFSLHRTKSDALLAANKISLAYYSTSNPKYSIKTERLNPQDFRPAVLDLSYKNGVIDNIIIRDSGAGYVEVPTIRISDGGKLDGSNIWYADVPFSKNGDRIIELSGPIVSKYNFYNENYNVLEESTQYSSGFTTITKTFTSVPDVVVNVGEGAEASAFTANGVITGLSLINPGTQYNLPPKVVITPINGGEGAVIESTIVNGKVSGFVIKNGGSGYTLPPRIDIVALEEDKAKITCKLREWTFNLVRELNKTERIDDFGGYVYDSGDANYTTSTYNKDKFNIIDYKNDFPKDIGEKQYYLLQNSNKLLAKYLLEKSPEGIIALAETLTGKTRNNFTDNDILDNFILHSLPIVVSYDGIPIYGGKRVLKERNKSLIVLKSDASNLAAYTAQFAESESRYRLKYTEVSAGTSGAITLTTTAGTKYVTLDRPGGPSITKYPIGTFIEDYEYVEPVSGDSTYFSPDDALDEHNGRFSITPEFPGGRYCYFSTTKSYDPITNALVESSGANNNGIGFNGFPYFIGDEFASEYDDYMNNKCRTNDKIPSIFTRSFEKNIDAIPELGFAGLEHNDEYPKENTSITKTVAQTSSITPGTVDSVIIESKGDNYRVGDKLIVDNNLTSGGGFSGIVSKVGGKEITVVSRSSDFLTTTFTTKENHGLAKNDLIYIEYKKSDTPIVINLVDNYLNLSYSQNRVTLVGADKFVVDLTQQQANQSIDPYNGVEVYTININFNYKYRFNIPSNSDWKLTYDIEKTNEFFTLEDSPVNQVIIDAQKIPNRLYLHIGTRIYQINKTRDYFGIQKITATTDKTFKIECSESTEGYETLNIAYNAKSFGASGPIEEVSITNNGNGYKKLPSISKIVKKGTENTIAGNGKAIIQTNSNTIGRIKKISYSSIGDSFTANNVVNHYVNIPATAKIINNFEISEVIVLTPGSNYGNTVTLLVNGKEGVATLKANVYLGTIVSVDVIDGGFNFSEEPTITVKALTDPTAVNGSGATFSVKIKRKDLLPKQTITGEINSLLFPVKISASVVNFDQKSSTIEFNEDVGQFKDGDEIKVGDRVYGIITSIRRSKAYAKVSPFGVLKNANTNISGHTSEVLQKITDSNYYQDWSYSISSSRDTKEWKPQQGVNTHPAGFKQFGKKIIERRKFFFRNPIDVFKSSVIFTTKITGLINLNLKLSPCGSTTLFLEDVSAFSVGDFIIGIESKAIGQIIEKNTSSIKVKLFNKETFIVGEIIVVIDKNYASNFSNSTYKTFNFWNGIWQEPDVSYNVTDSITYIPNYQVNDNDEILLYNFDVTDTITAGNFETGKKYTIATVGTTDFTAIGAIVNIVGQSFVATGPGSGNGTATTESKYVRFDTQIISPTQTSVSFTIDSTGYTINGMNTDDFVISVGGIVQDPSSYTISNNSIVFDSAFGYESKVIAVKHPKLSKLTLSGSGSTRTITSGQTITSDCQILLFRTGVFQSQLVTDFTRTGNTIDFGSESIPSGEVFGWHFDGTMSCQKINVADLKQNIISKILPCQKIDFTQFIESNAAKKPESLYELRKESISGTIVPVSATRVEGFDTKFSYTSPRESESLVEVMDPLTFNGSTTSFTLQTNSNNYTPSNGKESLIVNINNSTLHSSDYSVSGSTITFTTAYPASTVCTIIDFVSSYVSNTSNSENGTILPFLSQQQNGSKTVFTLSDRGVPKYTRNIGDIFAIKNGLLLEPTSSSYSLNQNRITFSSAPISTDVINLVYFNRQLTPTSTNNVYLEISNCYDGSDPTFPITNGGTLLNPVSINHVYVVRNGVYQRPGTDYTLTNGSFITFSDAPESLDNIFMYYSYDGLNQNIVIDALTGINGSQTTHALTNGGTAFSPPSVDDLMVFRNGVIQNPTEDFTVSGSNITFTTALETTDITFILYTHGSEEISVSNPTSLTSTTTRYTLGTSIAASDHDEVILFADGVPRFSHKNDISISGTTVTLTHEANITPTSVFVVKYPSVTLIDDPENCANGSRTKFRLLYNNANLVAANITEDADILMVLDGVVLNPGVDYTLNASRTQVTFTSAPAAGVDLYGIRMFNNTKRTLTNVSGNTYDLSASYTVNERENLVIFSNNTWKFAENGDFTWNDNNTVTLSSAHTTGGLFAIEFDGSFYLLDQIHTPFDSTRTKFNLLNQNVNSRKNFVPAGTVDNEALPSDSSLLVSKNGKLLESGYDFTLTGDIKSQIQFTTAPAAGDLITVRCVGSFDKLDTIASASGTQFPLTKSSNAYYPNAYIERPGELENQIIVTKNGDIQSPLYDYYIDNNKIVFLSSVSGARLAFLDFRGTANDIEVFDRKNQVSVGDKIYISGEDSARTVTGVLSPTVLTTSSYSGNIPSGFTATVTNSGGRVTGITMTDGGEYYDDSVIIRTKGTGSGAKITARVNTDLGENIVDSSSIEIVYPGSDIYTTQTAVATVNAKVYKEQPLHKTEIRKLTTLSTALTSSSGLLYIGNVADIPSNEPVVSISSSSGAGFDVGRVKVSNGKIVSVSIDNGGSGYNDMDVTMSVSGGGGSGCVLEPVLNASGTLTSIIVRNGGVGYDSHRVILINPTDQKEEIVEYTGVDTTNNLLYGVTRGVGGTTATTHNTTGTSVYFDDYL